MLKAQVVTVVALLFILFVTAFEKTYAANPAGAGAQKVIIDTDIGDDIDDAFALALALRSPQVEILGITTAWGDTELRARMVDRFLHATGYEGIPVAKGVPTHSTNVFTQAKWAEGGPQGRSYPDAVDFLLQQIRKFPGQITLICIGPLTNIGAAISRDPEGFRQVKRVVLMGGSVYRGYGDLGYLAPRGPQPEYNIFTDIAAAQALFRSKVRIAMMPLDSTQLHLDEVKRKILFQQGTPTTDALTLLYHQWGQQTPILFDAMAVAYVLQPSLCPTRPMHINVDEKGDTRVASGASNVDVCLDSDESQFFTFYMRRILGSDEKVSHSVN